MIGKTAESRLNMVTKLLLTYQFRTVSPTYIIRQSVFSRPAPGYEYVNIPGIPSLPYK
jgi:hypothetical protein